LKGESSTNLRYVEVEDFNDFFWGEVFTCSGLAT